MADRPSTAPTHELPVIVTENDTKTIHCIDLELTQKDLGYEPPAPGDRRTSAPLDIAVHADTVRLSTPLVLPGRRLTVVARTLVLAPGASVDVSGAEAATTFAPGDLPRQPDMSPAAAGAAGADAAAGGDAGAVTLVAERVLAAGSDAGGTGPVVDVVDLPTELDQRLPAALAGAAAAKLAAFAQAVAYMRSPWSGNDYPFTMFGGSVQVPDATLQWPGALTVRRVRTAPDGASVTATCTGTVSVALAASLQIQQLDNPGGQNNTTHPLPMAVGPCAVHVDLTVPLDAGWKLGDAQVTVTLPAAPAVAVTTPLTGSLEPVGRVAAEGFVIAAALGDRLRDAVAAAVRQPLLDVVAGLRQALHGDTPPALVVLARGHVGGRGQDGHPGIQGTKGDPGQDTQTEVYDGGPGIGWTVPPETCGKKGGPGGAAGSAGHSGAGGKGGTVTLQVTAGSAARIVLCCESGPGGDAARPGDRGPGGDGGDGHEYLVHDITVSGRYGHTEVGPNGPAGDLGAPARFAGEVGTPGAAGSVTVNGSPAAAGRPAAGPTTYDVIAPYYTVDQLLMTQRQAKLTYLNAQGATDYQDTATAHLWLVDICPPSVTDPTATNPIPPEDRATRAALRGSAQAELLRLHRGLDYFGHPYNWAPILRITHTQRRVTELVALGQVVEQQYAAYQATNATVADKLAALDQTLRALTQDLKAIDSATDVLNQQVTVTESTITSLQKDIDGQVSRMKRDEEAIEVLIRRELGDVCSLANVVAVVSAVVAIGAGAFNGVSEIAGAAEIGKIVDAAKAAAKAAGELKSAVDEIRKTTSTLDDLRGNLGAVNAAIAAGKPDSVKILAVRQDFEETIKPLLEKFPVEAKELRAATRAFLDLTDARNDKILAYNALFAQKAALLTRAQQTGAQISAVNVLRSRNAESVVPTPYLSFFKSALAWSKGHLVDLLYEETRAFYYHSGVSKAALLQGISDLNIGAIADTHARLLTAYDEFLNSVGRPYGPFTAVKVAIAKAERPEAFTGLAETGRMAFRLEHTHPSFANMTLVTLDSVEVRLPGVTGSAHDELNVAIQLTGEGEVRPVDDLAEDHVLRFNAAPRSVSYRFSYDPDRTDPVVEPGVVADEEYAPLSPFTTWTLDFGLAAGLNRFVTLADLETVELRLTGHAFGRKALKGERAAAGAEESQPVG